MIMWEETLSDRTRYARTEEYNKNKNNKQNKTLGNHVDSWLNQDRFLSRRRGSLLAEQSYHKHLSARVCYWICHQPEIQTWKRIFISIRAKKNQGHGAYKPYLWPSSVTNNTLNGQLIICIWAQHYTIYHSSLTINTFVQGRWVLVVTRWENTGKGIIYSVDQDQNLITLKLKSRHINKEK